MVTFDQAYWYTHECPLRMLDTPVFPESKGSSKLRGYIHEYLLDTFEDRTTYSPTKLIRSLNITPEKRGVGVNVFIRRIQQILINYEIWKTKLVNATTIDCSLSGEHNNMLFDIDIARLKSNGTRLQLIWFRYDMSLPSLDDFAKLVEKAQWNARGYHLTTGECPMQLTYYFPLLGTDYSVLYNRENNYDVIAQLIKDRVFYAKPSEVCDLCDMCPMSWVGYNSIEDK